MEIDPTTYNQISRVGLNSTDSSVTQLIQKTLSLNKKQFLIVKKILSHTIQYYKKAAINAQNQILLYINNKDGTRKNQIIKAIKLDYKLL